PASGVAGAVPGGTACPDGVLYRAKEGPRSRRAVGVAMSEENVEGVKRWFDWWNRADLDSQLSAMDPEFEFHTSGVFQGRRRVYGGLDGCRGFWRDFRAPWEAPQIVLEQPHATGDQVVALFTFHAVGRDGIAVERRGATVFNLRSGRVIRIEAFGGWA